MCAGLSEASDSGHPEQAKSSSHSKARSRSKSDRQSGASLGGESKDERLRELIRGIYRRHKPAKLSDIDTVFEKYSHSLEAAYEHLCKKYKEKPDGSILSKDKPIELVSRKQAKQRKKHKKRKASREKSVEEVQPSDNDVSKGHEDKDAKNAKDSKSVKKKKRRKERKESVKKKRRKESSEQESPKRPKEAKDAAASKRGGFAKKASAPPPPTPSPWQAPWQAAKLQGQAPWQAPWQSAPRGVPKKESALWSPRSDRGVSGWPFLNIEFCSNSRSPERSVRLAGGNGGSTAKTPSGTDSVAKSSEPTLMERFLLMRGSGPTRESHQDSTANGTQVADDARTKVAKATVSVCLEIPPADLNENIKVNRICFSKKATDANHPSREGLAAAQPSSFWPESPPHADEQPQVCRPSGEPLSDEFSIKDVDSEREDNGVGGSATEASSDEAEKPVSQPNDSAKEMVPSKDIQEKLMAELLQVEARRQGAIPKSAPTAQGQPVATAVATVPTRPSPVTSMVPGCSNLETLPRPAAVINIMAPAGEAVPQVSTQPGANLGGVPASSFPALQGIRPQAPAPAASGPDLRMPQIVPAGLAQHFSGLQSAFPGAAFNFSSPPTGGFSTISAPVGLGDPSVPCAASKAASFGRY